MYKNTTQRKTFGPWQLIAKKEKIWAADYRVPGLTARTIVFPLRDLGLVVISPGASLVNSLPPELLEQGQPEFLVAPNNYHHLGLAAWQKAHPGCVTVASYSAMPRLRQKGHTNIQPLDRLARRLPDSIQLMEPEGNRIGEVWVRIESQKQGIIWIVCDAFFNLPRLSNKLVWRMISRLLQSGPGLSISSLFSWGGLHSRTRYSAWVLRQIARDCPSVLIMAHGSIVADPYLPEKLRELVLQRF